jgi:hypothetical protein
MVNKNIIFKKEPGKAFEVFIYPIQDWDGFEKLIQYMKNEFSIQVHEQYDGPYSRRWKVSKKGVKFELIHEDGYGNYLVAPSLESEAIVKTIAEDLEKRLRNVT